MIFDDYFDKVYVISLKRQSSRRLGPCLEMLRERGLCDSPVVFEAVDGLKLTPPDWFAAKGGGRDDPRPNRGAWGCWLSHQTILREVVSEGLERVLILEDDVIWQPQASKIWGRFVGALPENWEQIYLGGQHTRPPENINGVAYRAVSVNRTHAYAVTLEGASKLLGHLGDVSKYQKATALPRWKGHVDTFLEVGHRERAWKVYAPSFWLAGQGAQLVSMSGTVPARWWHPIRHVNVELPVVVSDDAAGPALLGVLAGEKMPTKSRQLWRRWLRSLMREAFRHGQLPLIPASTRDWLGEGARVVAEPSEVDFVSDRPFAHPMWSDRPPLIVEKVKGPGPVFLFSTPRSLSTLLVRILNGSGVSMNGEAQGLLWELKALHSRRGALGDERPWSLLPLAEQLDAGCFPAHLCHSNEEVWDESFRALLKGFCGGGGDWGMKDVYLGSRGGEYLEEMCDWLVRLFPSARFVFLTRPYEETLASMASKQSWFIPSYASCMATMERRLTVQRAAFADWSAANASRSLVLSAGDVLDCGVLAAKLDEFGLVLSRPDWEREVDFKVRG